MIPVKINPLVPLPGLDDGKYNHIAEPIDKRVIIIKGSA